MFIVILAITLTVLIFNCFISEKNIKENNKKNNNLILVSTQLKKLTTDGGVNIIENNTKNEVRLRGVVFPGGVGQHPFSTPQAVKYHTTEWDIKNIKSWGVNVILFYIDYHWFNTDKGYEHIEEILNWCRKYDIYIIPHLNVLPIGGWRGGPAFFASEQAKKQVIEFWKKFVSRYKDREEIGGYGILDEPHAGGESIHDPVFKKKLKKYMESIIDEIRKIDQITPIYIGTVYGSPYGFITIDDSKKHIVYNIHFYEPMAYTHILYPLISAGGVSEKVEYPGWYIDSIISDYNNPSQTEHYPIVSGGTSNGWDEYLVETTVPDLNIFETNIPPDIPKKTYLAYLNIFSNGDKDAIIYYDNFQYSLNGEEFIPVNNGSFETPLEWDEKSPLIWNRYLAKTGIVERTSEYAYHKNYSIKFENCSGWSHFENIDYWISSAGAIDVSDYIGKSFKIKFYVKTNNASKGLNGIQIKWATACKKYLDDTKLRSLIDELIINRRNTLNRPFFIGEFTPLLPSKTPDRLKFLSDEIEYFELNKLHWTYYVYRENLTNPDRRYLGIYNGPIGVEAKNCYVDNNILDVLKSFYPR